MTTGKIFSGYFLFKKLSEEPFGETFRAGRLLGNVVDRIVLLQLFNGPEIEIESFWKLVRNRGPLHQAVSDPHIADGVEFGISDGVPFAAYEYRPGKTLWQFLNEAQSQSFPVPTDQALFVVERIALALTAAYGTQLLGRPVVHGFLVPELVRLSDEGHVHLTGFASAPGLRSQLAGKSSYRSYLAPEVRSWDPPIETDDVFSLGAILFQLLTTKCLPEEPQTNWTTLVDASVLPTGEPIPEEIRQLLLHTFAPREHRIPTAATWQRLLSKLILDGEYNPTTFNLAYLIHTLFREELEQERLELEKARAFKFDPSKPDEKVEPPPETPTVIPAEDPIPIPPPSAEPQQGHRSFFLGLASSILVASLLMTAYFLMRQPGEAQVEEPDSGSTPTVEPSSSYSDAFTGQLNSPSVPLIDAEEPNPTTGEENPPERIQLLIEERSQELETSLRAEYERQMRALRTQLDEARRAAAATALEEKKPEGEPALTAPPPSEPESGQEEGPTDPRLPEQEPPETPNDGPETSSAAVVQSEPGETSDSTPPDGTEEPLPLDDGTASESPTEPPAASPGTGSVSQPESERETAIEEVAVVPPQLLRPPQVIYPASARRQRKSAEVRVRALIDETGQVQETEILGPRAGFGFDREALTAVKKSLWEPARRNGQAIAAWRVLTIEFEP
jgi:protein TonB